MSASALRDLPGGATPGVMGENPGGSGGVAATGATSGTTGATTVAAPGSASTCADALFANPLGNTGKCLTVNKTLFDTIYAIGQ